ncbi:unnamed protein product [Nezara viridula]|uniref:Odorant receptor n=1 Tax=Nezara viridula TaxID=85310 RepID=A0A9P0GZW3_NEZVI|nr:unnamed protein product [Nezara viridula]
MPYHPPLEESNVIDGLRVGYLKFFGFWNVINDYKTTGKRNAFINFHFYSNIIICTPFIVLQLICYFFIDMDIQKAIRINLHFLPAIMMGGRIMVFWFRIESQSKLCNLIQKDFLHIPEYKMAKACIIYRKITRNANILCILAYIVDFSVVFSNLCIPGTPVDYIMYHKGNIFDVKTGKKKLLSAWYPLPMGESPYYEIIFVYEAICLLIGGIYQPTYACLFYQILVGLHAQFVVLGYHASTMYDSSNSNSNRNLIDTESKCNSKSNSNSNSSLRKIAHEYIDSDMNKELYSIIQDHHKLLRQSSDIQIAVYSSDWYKADVKFRKSAQLLMMGAEKGVTLTAIKMYPVNKETLMAILQYVYSTCALMSGLLEK